MTTVQESIGADRFDPITRHRCVDDDLHHRHLSDLRTDDAASDDLAPSHLRSWREPGVICVAGEVDLWSAPAFCAALDACDADSCIHALDLSAVEFFSSAGVSCFIERAWTVRPHASIIASPSVRRVLTLCDMEYLLGRHGWRGAYDGWRVRRYPSF